MAWQEWMRRVTIALLVAIIAGLLCVLSVNTANYGWVLFVGVPFFVGFAVTALMAVPRPRELMSCVLWSLAAGVILAAGFLLSTFEGLICVLMAVPLVLPPVVVGALLSWVLFHSRRLRRGKELAAGLALLLAALIPVEVTLHGPSSDETLLVEDHEIVEATRAEVWATIVTLADVERPDDLLFRAGGACPQRTRIVEGAEGGLRVCTLSTGTLLERIDRWQPDERLSWVALSTPPPLEELNPFGKADPPHLHGFYRNIRGEFELAPAGPRRTRLTRRTWYQQDLYPAFYWRLWCDFGASKVHRLVLEHVRRQAERRGGRSV